MVTEKDRTTPPPPPRHGCPCPYVDGGVGLDNAEQLSPLCREGGKAVNSQPRATYSSDVIHTNDGTDRITFGSKVANCVTVNGVKLTDLQKVKTTFKKTTSNKNTPQSLKKKKTPLPTLPPSGQILKYLVKKKAVVGPGVSSTEETTAKQEDNANIHEEINVSNTPSNVEDNDCDRKTTSHEAHKIMKTTFTVEKKCKVKENIKMFQELEKGQDCVMRSGMCATHNTKLDRNVVKKRMSVMTAGGNVEWVMSEGVTLTCPLRRPIGNCSVMTSLPAISDGAIGNKRICLRDEMDQPQTTKFGREDLLLDKQ